MEEGVLIIVNNVKNRKEYYLYYLSLLNYEKFALEYAKYLKVPSLCRLKNISYFCYVDYGSKEVFDFKEHISRFDHSLTTALLTQKFASSKVEVLAGLFHDIAVQHTVCLNSFGLDGWTLAGVENAILQHNFICGSAHFTAERIDFKDKLSFSCAAD